MKEQHQLLPSHLSYHLYVDYPSVGNYLMSWNIVENHIVRIAAIIFPIFLRHHRHPRAQPLILLHQHLHLSGIVHWQKSILLLVHLRMKIFTFFPFNINNEHERMAFPMYPISWTTKKSLDRWLRLVYSSRKASVVMISLFCHRVVMSRQSVQAHFHRLHLLQYPIHRNQMVSLFSLSFSYLNELFFIGDEFFFLILSLEKEHGLSTSSTSRIHHRALAKTSAGKERNEKRNSTGSAVFSPVSWDLSFDERKLINSTSNRCRHINELTDKYLTDVVVSYE